MHEQGVTVNLGTDEGREDKERANNSCFEYKKMGRRQVGELHGDHREKRVTLSVSDEARSFWVKALVVMVFGVVRSSDWVIVKLREHFGVRGEKDIKPFSHDRGILVCDAAAAARIRMVDRGDIVVEGSQIAMAP